MNFTRTAVITVATSTLLTGIGFGASAANAATGDGTDTGSSPASVDFPVTVDPVAIGDAITKASISAQNRSGFVKDVMYNAFYNAGQQHYNVVVMNLSQNHDVTGLNGVAGYKDATYDGVTYGVWLFKDGTFVNSGDGGWDNWATMGYFTRTDDGWDKTVTYTEH